VPSEPRYFPLLAQAVDRRPGSDKSELAGRQAIQGLPPLANHFKHIFVLQGCEVREQVPEIGPDAGVLEHSGINCDYALHRSVLRFIGQE
jgi:hypothetical protein